MLAMLVRDITVGSAHFEQKKRCFFVYNLNALNLNLKLRFYNQVKVYIGEKKPSDYFQRAIRCGMAMHQIMRYLILRRV